MDGVCSGLQQHAAFPNYVSGFSHAFWINKGEGLSLTSNFDVLLTSAFISSGLPSAAPHNLIVKSVLGVDNGGEIILSINVT